MTRIDNPVEHVEQYLAGTSQGPWTTVGPTAEDPTVRLIAANGRTVATIDAGVAGWERMTALADAVLLAKVPILLTYMAKEVEHARGEEGRFEDMECELSRSEDEADDLRSDYQTLAARIADRIADLSVDAYETADAMRAAAEAIAREEADYV